MAEIAPFKGVRYDQSTTGDLSKVTSPPYDVISPEDRVHYHMLHPCNFVRLVLGEEFEGDDESNNRFTRARDYLAQWLQQGAMKQDPEPAIYLYEQQFERGARPCAVRGIIAAVKIHEYSDRVILPHENTLAKPKSQLIQLIRETRANLDSVYGLYADGEGILEAVMDDVMRRPADAESLDKDGVKHSVWVISDPDQIGSIVDFMRDQQIAIADGHHRYETALAYRDEVRAKTGYDGANCRELPSDYAMMTLMNVHQPDMTIFPTHRVIAAVPEEMLAGLDEGVSELFEAHESSPETLIDDMARLGGIGVYRPGAARVLKPKAGASSRIQGSEASRSLELNVLHKLILEPLLGIDDEKLRNQTHIIYTRDANEAMRLVDSGERQIAFLVNHIEVKSVLDIAAAGEKMPQKATYFYPKLLSGLVLRRM